MAPEGIPRTRLVLLVDDDLRTARRLAEMLREDGLAVEIARDGAAAISRFTHAPLPDALVTELNTAHADAASVTRFARAQRPGMPVLVVTGYPNLFQSSTFGEPSALLFTKPIDYAKLKDSLLSALSPADGAPSAPVCAVPVPLSPLARLESLAKDAAGPAGDPLPGAQALRAIRRP